MHTLTAVNGQRVYNTLFPHYVEVCVVTQLHRKGGQPGGWGGHASLFLGGAEIDVQAGYPRIRTAGAEADLSDPDAGVGISVNKIFRNVAWVAVPGRDEFFRGGLGPDAVLDEAFYEATVERAAASGWFDGIHIDERVMATRGTIPEREFVVRHSIGTDFALSFGRTAYTVRLAMDAGRLGAVAAYLNEVNARARERGYSWDAYTNNCSHVVHNALAAAGVWDPKAARDPNAFSFAMDLLSVGLAIATRRMSDLSFPANTFVRLYEAGNERPIDDASAALAHHDIARTLHAGWLVTGPGSLITRQPMQPAARNQIFLAGRDPFLFSVPVIWDKEATFLRLTRQPADRVVDLGANLRYFRERFARALTHRSSAGENADRFYDVLARDLAATEARIAEYQRLYH